MNSACGHTRSFAGIRIEFDSVRDSDRAFGRRRCPRVLSGETLRLPVLLKKTPTDSGDQHKATAQDDFQKSPQEIACDFLEKLRLYVHF
jgi:hypothetical protein